MLQNLENPFSLDALIKKNNEFIPKLIHFSDRLNSIFTTGDVKFKIWNPEDDLCEDEMMPPLKPLIIYGRFAHEVVLQLKGKDTQEDTTDSVNHTTIYGVSISFETHPPEMIPMTGEYFRDDLELLSGIPTCAYGNFLEDPEALDYLVKVTRGILDTRIH
jgi:hypothetical protein